MKIKLVKDKRIIFPMVAIISFVIINSFVFYVNHLVPFMMDDDWYSTKLFCEDKIQNLTDIIEAQKWHYMNWGGRVVAHSILQVVLLAGEVVADILNTLFLVLTGALINKLASLAAGKKGNIWENVLSISLIEGVVLGASANWKMSMFWQAGACNYLYMTVFILLFLTPYVKELLGVSDGKTEKKVACAILMIPLGIASGCSNENMGPVCFLFALATVFFSLKRKKTVAAWMLIGTSSSLLGAVACILAPGNMVRAKEVKSAGFGVIWKTYLALFYESRAIFEYLIIAIAVCAVAYVLYRFSCNLKVDVTLVFILSSALLAWGAMILSPHYPDRATYGTMIFLVLASTIMLKRALERNNKLTPFVLVFVTFIMLRGLYFLNEFIGNCYYWIVY